MGYTSKFLCMLCNFLLRNKHFGHYNVVTLEIRFSSSIALLLDEVVCCYSCLFSLSTFFFFCRLYSLSCVFTEVLFCYLCDQPMTWQSFTYMQAFLFIRHSPGCYKCSTRFQSSKIVNSISYCWKEQFLDFSTSPSFRTSFSHYLKQGFSELCAISLMLIFSLSNPHNSLVLLPLLLMSLEGESWSKQGSSAL